MLVAGNGHRASRGDVAAWAEMAEESLRAAGARPGGFVLLSAVNGAGFLSALVGTRRAGCIPVLADRSSPEAELTRIAEALGIEHFLRCDQAFPSGRGAFAIRSEKRFAGTAPEGSAYVKLTSGSTGAPSGVAVSAEALAADDDQLASSMGLTASDRIVASIPWSHSYGLSSVVMPALRRGALLIAPQDAGPWAPLLAAREHGATVFPTVPAYLQAISSLSSPPPWPETLRRVISAGAPLSAETASRFQDVFGVRAHVFYGASESGGITYDRDGDAALRGTVGTAVDGVDIALEPDGRVVVRSGALGLRHVPDSEERLEGGVFESADVAEWAASGELRLLGRADAVINVAGRKVQSAEIESALRAMPGVRDAYVLGVPGDRDGRTIVRAYVACDPDDVSYADVAAWCRRHLSGYKVPRSIVRLPEIPRNARGKIDRATLLACVPAE